MFPLVGSETTGQIQNSLKFKNCILATAEAKARAKGAFDTPS